MRLKYKSNSFKWLLLCCLLVLLIGGSVSLYASHAKVKGLTNQSSDDSAIESGPTSSYATIKRGNIKKILTLEGELRAVNSRTIFTPRTDDVKIVYLPLEGSTVKAGEKLVELDSGTIIDNIKDIEEKIIAAENEIVQTQSTNESALSDMEIDLSKLWLAYEQAKVKARAPASVVSRRDYQENQMDLEKTKTEYENEVNKIAQKRKEQAAELKVKNLEKSKLELQLNQATNSMNGMKIVSPSDGMVIYADSPQERRKLQVGDIVWSGIPIVRLPDLKEMEVLAQVNEVDGPRLFPGQKTTVSLDSFPEKSISGSIKSITQTAVKASFRSQARVFMVVISLDNTIPEIMKPGMSAQVSITLSEVNNNLLVPRSAISFEKDSVTVTRVESYEVFRPVAVTITSFDSIFYSVADNGALKEGDKVVLHLN